MKTIAFLFLLATVSFAWAELGPAVVCGSGKYPWMPSGTDGCIHVVYNGKYRKGPDVNNMGFGCALEAL